MKRSISTAACTRGYGPCGKFVISVVRVTPQQRPSRRVAVQVKGTSSPSQPQTSTNRGAQQTSWSGSIWAPIAFAAGGLLLAGGTLTAGIAVLKTTPVKDILWKVVLQQNRTWMENVMAVGYGLLCIVGVVIINAAATEVQKWWALRSKSLTQWAKEQQVDDLVAPAVVERLSKAGFCKAERLADLAAERPRRVVQLLQGEESSMTDDEAYSVVQRLKRFADWRESMRK